jgi:hypothetical protein
MHIQNYTKIIKLLTLSDDEPVKRASVGSGRAPVASETGAEAPAAAGGVGAALVLLGRRWSYRAMWAEARARAGRRGGAGGRQERLGRRCRVTAAAAGRRRRRRWLGSGGYACEERERRQNEPTRARAVG